MVLLRIISKTTSGRQQPVEHIENMWKMKIRNNINIFTGETNSEAFKCNMAPVFSCKRTRNEKKCPDGLCK